uniref:PDZ domain-containing protein n=1 Tax=Bursaphelenchus xylophilus TaxID=6326 RepID=A0A1I7S290_BURXY
MTEPTSEFSFIGRKDSANLESKSYSGTSESTDTTVIDNRGLDYGGKISDKEPNSTASDDLAYADNSISLSYPNWGGASTASEPVPTDDLTSLSTTVTNATEDPRIYLHDEKIEPHRSSILQKTALEQINESEAWSKADLALMKAKTFADDVAQRMSKYMNNDGNETDARKLQHDNDVNERMEAYFSEDLPERPDFSKYLNRKRDYGLDADERQDLKGSGRGHDDYDSKKPRSDVFGHGTRSENEQETQPSGVFGHGTRNSDVFGHGTGNTDRYSSSQYDTDVDGGAQGNVFGHGTRNSDVFGHGVDKYDDNSTQKAHQRHLFGHGTGNKVPENTPSDTPKNNNSPPTEATANNPEGIVVTQPSAEVELDTEEIPPEKLLNTSRRGSFVFGFAPSDNEDDDFDPVADLINELVYETNEINKSMSEAASKHNTISTDNTEKTLQNDDDTDNDLTEPIQPPPAGPIWDINYAIGLSDRPKDVAGYVVINKVDEILSKDKDGKPIVLRGGSLDGSPKLNERRDHLTRQARVASESENGLEETESSRMETIHEGRTDSQDHPAASEISKTPEAIPTPAADQTSENTTTNLPHDPDKKSLEFPKKHGETNTTGPEAKSVEGHGTSVISGKIDNAQFNENPNETSEIPVVSAQTPARVSNSGDMASGLASTTPIATDIPAGTTSQTVGSISMEMEPMKIVQKPSFGQKTTSIQGFRTPGPAAEVVTVETKFPESVPPPEPAVPGDTLAFMVPNNVLDQVVKNVQENEDKNGSTAANPTAQTPVQPSSQIPTWSATSNIEPSQPNSEDSEAKPVEIPVQIQSEAEFAANKVPEKVTITPESNDEVVVQVPINVINNDDLPKEPIKDNYDSESLFSVVSGNSLPELSNGEKIDEPVLINKVDTDHLLSFGVKKADETAVPPNTPSSGQNGLNGSEKVEEISLPQGLVQPQEVKTQQPAQQSTQSPEKQSESNIFEGAVANDSTEKEVEDVVDMSVELTQASAEGSRVNEITLNVIIERRSVGESAEALSLEESELLADELTKSAAGEVPHKVGDETKEGDGLVKKAEEERTETKVPVQVDAKAASDVKVAEQAEGKQTETTSAKDGKGSEVQPIETQDAQSSGYKSDGVEIPVEINKPFEPVKDADYGTEIPVEVNKPLDGPAHPTEVGALENEDAKSTTSQVSSDIYGSKTSEFGTEIPVEINKPFDGPVNPPSAPQEAPSQAHQPDNTSGYGTEIPVEINKPLDGPAHPTQVSQKTSDGPVNLSDLSSTSLLEKKPDDKESKEQLVQAVKSSEAPVNLGDLDNKSLLEKTPAEKKSESGQPGAKEESASSVQQEPVKDRDYGTEIIVEINKPLDKPAEPVSEGTVDQKSLEEAAKQATEIPVEINKPLEGPAQLNDSGVTQDAANVAEAKESAQSVDEPQKLPEEIKPEESKISEVNTEKSSEPTTAERAAEKPSESQPTEPSEDQKEHRKTPIKLHEPVQRTDSLGRIIPILYINEEPITSPPHDYKPLGYSRQLAKKEAKTEKKKDSKREDKDDSKEGNVEGGDQKEKEAETKSDKTVDKPFEPEAGQDAPKEGKTQVDEKSERTSEPVKDADYGTEIPVEVNKPLDGPANAAKSVESEAKPSEPGVEIPVEINKSPDGPAHPVSNESAIPEESKASVQEKEQKDADYGTEIPVEVNKPLDGPAHPAEPKPEDAAKDSEKSTEIPVEINKPFEPVKDSDYGTEIPVEVNKPLDGPTHAGISEKVEDEIPKQTTSQSEASPQVPVEPALSESAKISGESKPSEAPKVEDTSKPQEAQKPQIPVAQTPDGVDLPPAENERPTEVDELEKTGALSNQQPIKLGSLGKKSLWDGEEEDGKPSETTPKSGDGPVNLSDLSKTSLLEQKPDEKRVGDVQTAAVKPPDSPVKPGEIGSKLPLDKTPEEKKVESDQAVEKREIKTDESIPVKTEETPLIQTAPTDSKPSENKDNISWIEEKPTEEFVVAKPSEVEPSYDRPAESPSKLSEAPKPLLERDEKAETTTAQPSGPVKLEDLAKKPLIEEEKPEKVEKVNIPDDGSAPIKLNQLDNETLLNKPSPASPTESNVKENLVGSDEQKSAEETKPGIPPSIGFYEQPESEKEKPSEARETKETLPESPKKGVPPSIGFYEPSPEDGWITEPVESEVKNVETPAKIEEKESPVEPRVEEPKKEEISNDGWITEPVEGEKKEEVKAEEKKEDKVEKKDVTAEDGWITEPAEGWKKEDEPKDLKASAEPAPTTSPASQEPSNDGWITETTSEIPKPEESKPEEPKKEVVSQEGWITEPAEGQTKTETLQTKEDLLIPDGDNKVEEERKGVSFEDGSRPEKTQPAGKETVLVFHEARAFSPAPEDPAAAFNVAEAGKSEAKMSESDKENATDSESHRLPMDGSDVDLDEYERRLIANTREALALVDKLCKDTQEQQERRRARQRDYVDQERRALIVEGSDLDVETFKLNPELLDDPQGVLMIPGNRLVILDNKLGLTLLNLETKEVKRSPKPEDWRDLEHVCFMKSQNQILVVYEQKIEGESGFMKSLARFDLDLNIISKCETPKILRDKPVHNCRICYVEQTDCIYLAVNSPNNCYLYELKECKGTPRWTEVYNMRGKQIADISVFAVVGKKVILRHKKYNICDN